MRRRRCGAAPPAPSVETSVAFGSRLLKPAASAALLVSPEVGRGTGALRGIGGPLPELRFCATGGIGIDNARQYLAPGLFSMLEPGAEPALVELAGIGALQALA